MTETSEKKQQQPIDAMPRDARGFWQPERGTAPANPWFSWPLKPAQALRWLFGFPGYLFPWNLVYMGIATLTWIYFQPALSRCVEFRADWILEMFARNQLMLAAVVSAWHLRLWTLKSQGHQVQVHRRLDGDGKAQVPRGEPASRQRLLELRQQLHGLDRV